MKILLTVLIFIFSFQTLTRAEDIRDFEIEGMSIGDSALKFISEEEIVKNIRKDAYKGSDGKFYDTSMHNSLKQYDEVALILKKCSKKWKTSKRQIRPEPCRSNFFFSKK